MTTFGARRAISIDEPLGVLSRAELKERGFDDKAVRPQINAGRWQRFGTAIVLHNGPITRRQCWEIGRIAAGPHAILTSFTAAEAMGLRGWERDAVHVLAPPGTRLRLKPAFPICLHEVAHWSAVRRHGNQSMQALPDALLVAASSFQNVPPAWGLLAAAVQQKLVQTRALDDALSRHPRLRHRHLLALAVADIAGGAEALSEIDFARLCRDAGLPEPVRQAIRTEPNGRRRYLDAEWVLPDGRRLVVEVDGSVHLVPDRWFDDQMRQNVVTLSGAIVLRFPSMVVRTRPEVVVAQLRQALFGRR